MLNEDFPYHDVLTQLVKYRSSLSGRLHKTSCTCLMSISLIRTFSQNKMYFLNVDFPYQGVLTKHFVVVECRFSSSGRSKRRTNKDKGLNKGKKEILYYTHVENIVPLLHALNDVNSDYCAIGSI